LSDSASTSMTLSIDIFRSFDFGVPIACAKSA